MHAPQRRSNYRLLHWWQVCEGGTAKNNPLNTTEPWAGATDYNSAGVKNYKTGKDGIAATVTTLENGHYPGIVMGMRAGLPAKEIVTKNAKEFDTWGTGTTCILKGLS